MYVSSTLSSHTVNSASISPTLNSYTVCQHPTSGDKPVVPTTTLSSLLCSAKDYSAPAVDSASLSAARRTSCWSRANLVPKHAAISSQHAFHTTVLDLDVNGFLFFGLVFGRDDIWQAVELAKVGECDCECTVYLEVFLPQQLQTECSSALAAGLYVGFECLEEAQK